jgi:hypothetical protein
MLDRLLDELRATASAWEGDVAARRKITAHDPVADTRAYDARELRHLATKLEEATAELTARDFASLHKTTPQTVISWIHAKKIPARKTANGWRIPGDTLPPKWKRRRAKRSSPT